MILKET